MVRFGSHKIEIDSFARTVYVTGRVGDEDRTYQASFESAEQLDAAYLRLALQHLQESYAAGDF